MRRITGRRALGDALMSAGSVLILLMVLVAVDDRVRSEVWQRASAPSVGLETAGYQVQNMAHVIAGAARHQSLEHTPLLIFALAAGVLTIFMLRT